jgi:KipI family sensor histidine kinase inhibitor
VTSHPSPARGPLRIVASGDSSLTIELGARVDPQVNARAIAIARRVTAAGLAGIRDVVTAYHTVAVYFDPLAIDGGELRQSLEALAAAQGLENAGQGRTHMIPVCYGGEFGPDLAEVAAFARATPDEVVALYCATSYRVYMLGFVPGFAYLGSVPDRLGLPRRSTPRLKVPAGSVALAGSQTGIYPRETPGGWNLIGRTPVKPFDARREDPFLLRPGDEVRFVPISVEEFARQPS